MAVTGDANTGQATALPTRKVAGGGLAGTLGVVLVWLYNTYVSPDAPLSSEAASAVTTVLTFLAAYFVPPSGTEAVLANGVGTALRQPG